MQDFKEFYHARIAWNQGQQPKVDEGKEEYIMKKGQFTRKVDGKTADKMKRQGWKLVAKEGIKIKESFALFEGRGPKIKDIKRKFKREIEKFQKGGDLDWKAENALLAWALEYTNDIKTDDADEMDDWLMDKIADKKSFDKLKESLDEALSDAEKKKRLAMIKKAVEKIDKKNMAKAKKDAMAMMKASGMFDESSASWAKSLDDIAKKRQLDKISDKDKATLMKIAAMLAKEKK